MVYGMILAAGKGTRMGYTQLPKQFLLLNNKPVIIHTIEKFIISSGIDKIVVVVNNEWVSHLNDLLIKYIPNSLLDNVFICRGGNDRNESVYKGILFIEDNFGVNNDDIVVTHDAVRPFVSSRIIEENIIMAKKYGATDTVVKATDTIVNSNDFSFIEEIPNRDFMYLGQTPQSFDMLKLKELLVGLSNEDKLTLTDCAKIFVLNEEKVKLVEGDYSNIKITTPFDLKMANILIKEGFSNDK